MLSSHVATAVVAALAALGGMALAEPYDTGPWPACQYEDGNPDGTECAWADPDTGAVFWVDSSNYRWR